MTTIIAKTVLDYLKNILIGQSGIIRIFLKYIFRDFYRVIKGHNVDFPKDILGPKVGYFLKYFIYIGLPEALK